MRDAVSGACLLSAQVFIGARIHGIAHCIQARNQIAEGSCLLALRGGAHLCLAALQCDQSLSAHLSDADEGAASSAARWHVTRLFAQRICRHWILAVAFVPPAQQGSSSCSAGNSSGGDAVCSTAADVQRTCSRGQTSNQAAERSLRCVDLLLGFSDNSVELWQLCARGHTCGARDCHCPDGAADSDSGPSSMPALAVDSLRAPAWRASRLWRVQSSARLLLYCMDVRIPDRRAQNPSACGGNSGGTGDFGVQADVASGAHSIISIRMLTAIGGTWAMLPHEHDMLHTRAQALYETTLSFGTGEEGCRVVNASDAACCLVRVTMQHLLKIIAGVALGRDTR